MPRNTPQRVALHAVLRDGQVGVYREKHARVPDELAQLFSDAGIHEWDMWRSGRHVFHLVVCDNFEDAMARISASPINDRWMDYIGIHIDRFEGADSEGLTPSEPIWSLSAQKDR